MAQTDVRKRARLLVADWRAHERNTAADAVIAVPRDQAPLERGDVVDVEGLGLCIADVIELEDPEMKPAWHLEPEERAVRLDLQRFD